MNRWFGLSTLILTLVACTPQFSDKQQSASSETSVPSGLEKAPVERLPNAAEAEKVSLQYTPAAEKQTFYFSVDSKPSPQPVSGGYYREVLGYTADGRAVVQDFYQDIGKPQTQAFILTKNADPTDFSSETMDSKGVWYRPDGSLFHVQEFSGGKHTSPAWFFENGLAIAKIENDTLAYYHSDGTVFARQMFLKAENTVEMRLFRPNGIPLLRLQMTRNGEESQIKNAEAWDENGRPVDPKSIEAEARPMLTELSRREAALSQDSGFVMGEPAIPEKKE